MDEKLQSDTLVIGTFDDETDDLAFWLNQAPEDRIKAVEIITSQFYSYGKAEQELRRFFEIAERKKD